MTSGRPSLTIHYAQTLDGRIATGSGESQWISCEETRRLAHRLRAEHDAVMVGVGTVLRDDPQLTVRLVSGRSPLRVIVDSTLRTPLKARVVTDHQVPTVLATTRRADEKRVATFREAGVDVLTVASDHVGRVSLIDLLPALRDRAVSSILVEGGAGLITSLLEARLANRLVVCIAPKLLGEGIDAVGDLHARTMDEALEFEASSFTMVGEDIIFDGRLA